MIVKIHLVLVAMLFTGTTLISGLFAETPEDNKPGENKYSFAQPERVKAAGQYIKTERPGYASPSWADMDGDGKKDLLVGQFAGGKIKVYRNLGQGALAEGEWLKAAGEIAKVPGVW